MTREEAFNRLEQMYDFYARAMDSDKNHPFEGDAEAIKVALLVIAQDRSAHITREQVEKTQKKNEISGDPEVCAKNIFGSDILCHRNCWICWNKPAPKEYQNMDKKKVEVEDRWAYMEDGSAVCPRCGKRYERRKFEFVGACCEACGANNIVKTEIKEDE